MNRRNLAIVTALFLAVRLFAIFTSQMHVDPDAAYYSMIARYISSGEIFPFYAAMHYNGGITIESYLAAFTFTVFGISDLSVKLTVLAVTLLCTVLFYYFMEKFFGEKTAIIAGLIFAMSTSVFTPYNILLVGYMSLLVSFMILLILFYRITFDRSGQWFLFGIASGLAYYVLEYSVVLVFSCLLFWLITRRKELVQKLPVLAVSFFVGFLPVLIYNVLNNLANFKHLVAGTFVHRIACEYNLVPKAVEFGDRVVSHCDVFTMFEKGQSITGLFTRTIPHLFSYFWIRWVFYIAFIGCLALVIYTNIRKRNHKEIFIVFSFLVFMIAYLVSGYRDIQHLFPAYIFIFIIFAMAIRKMKKAQVVVLVLLLAFGLADNIMFSGGVYRNPGEYHEIISFLNENGIRYVYASHFIKWKIIWHSEEAIPASCLNLCPCQEGEHISYDDFVKGSDDFAVILHENSAIEKTLRDYMEKVPHNARTIDKKVIYYGFEPFDLKGAIPGCTYSDGAPVV